MERYDDHCRFVLQDHLRTLYAPHLLYASEADYNDPNIEQEPESRSFTGICTEFLDEIQKLVANQTAKVDVDPEPDIVNKPASKPQPKVSSYLKIRSERSFY